MMTEELRVMLNSSLTSEKEDDGKYEMMANIAERDGECHVAGVLRDIAHEEKTHAKLVKEILEGGWKK